jgi:hypothetical protein
MDTQRLVYVRLLSVFPILSTESDSVNDISSLAKQSSTTKTQPETFENGITSFTNLIYTAIRYTVSNGDVTPFVGYSPTCLRLRFGGGVTGSEGEGA